MIEFASIIFYVGNTLRLENMVIKYSFSLTSSAKALLNLIFVHQVLMHHSY